jgi:hypothetical protein
MMRFACGLLALGLVGGSFAQEKPMAQQERMKTCNAQATENQLKGDDRQQFMSTCLTGKEPRDLTAHQQKMVTCNRTAGDQQLKGEKRRKFMKECLSAKADSVTTPQARMRDCNQTASSKRLKGAQRRAFMGDCLKGGDSAAVGGR